MLRTIIKINHYILPGSNEEDLFMECPYCGKTDTEVIDSRLSKDAMTIRRRRQCVICLERFTTYEATVERLLPFLIGKSAGQEATIPNVRTMLSFMLNTLKGLSRETNNLIGKIEKSEKAQAVKESKRKARERELAKRKAKSLMMAETAFKIIRTHRRGIDISKLKDRTRLDAKKINKIVFELRKQGKIKSLRRGFYVKA